MGISEQDQDRWVVLDLGRLRLFLAKKEKARGVTGKS